MLNLELYRRDAHIHDHEFGALCLHQHRQQIWMPGRGAGRRSA